MDEGIGINGQRKSDKDKEIRMGILFVRLRLQCNNTKEECLLHYQPIFWCSSFQSDKNCKLSWISQLVLLIRLMLMVAFVRSLESTFVYKMMIYDSINNILFSIISSFGITFHHPFQLAPICGIVTAANFGLTTFSKMVPLLIVFYR